MSNLISINLASSIIDNIGEKFINVMIVLNDLLSKILITVKWDNLENNNLVLQVLLGLSVFIATILLGIDSNLNVGRIYRKKYLVMVYSIITLIYFSNKGIINLDTLVLTILLILFLNSISGINTAYNLSLLEKELDPLSFFSYSSYRWFFIAKSYISIMLLVVLFLLSKFNFLLSRTDNLGLEYLDEIIMFIMILFFFLLHIVMDVIDRFGHDDFDEFKKKLETKIDIYSESKSLTVKEYFRIDRTNDELLDMLGLILYIEDRDFMKRSKPTFSFYLVFRRKLKSISLIEIIHNKRNNLIKSV